MKAKNLALLAGFCLLAPGEAKPALDYVALTNIQVTSGFWQARLETNRLATIPHVLRMCEEAGLIDNFARAGGLIDGPMAGTPNSDEFVYKAVEAAAWSLMRKPDPALEARLDGIIAKIAAAQEEDGYLLTPRTIALRRGLDPKARPRWSNLGDDLELYCAGHLYEAAATHFQATGKRNLLEVALKNAELVHRLFGPGKRIEVCGHEEIELALVRLFQVTGDQRWWKLAKFFVDTRGTAAGGRKPRGPFSQDHAPLFEQTEAVGQAPRATYFYSAAADIGILTGDPRYRSALERLWDNVVGRKMYITGGIGSRHANEGFGEDFELPNLKGFTESCAAVSFPMWNARMFRLTGQTRYLDVLERTLYNNFLAGLSLDGIRFFYACPPESDGQFKFNIGWVPAGFSNQFTTPSCERKEWFACACCPPTLARWMEQIPGFAYATSENQIFVNLFLNSTAAIKLGDTKVILKQETDYPWNGRVQITVNPSARARFSLLVRIPGWARGEPVPSRLYRFLTLTDESFSVKINGRPVTGAFSEGFVRMDREWQAGDLVELDLPMPVQQVVAAPQVKENHGKVALQCGPIVFGAEGIDHGGTVLDLSLPESASFKKAYQASLLGGVMTLHGAARRGHQTVPFKAIPHYAWGNRGAGEMAIWMK